MCVCVCVRARAFVCVCACSVCKCVRVYGLVFERACMDRYVYLAIANKRAHLKVPSSVWAFVLVTALFALAPCNGTGCIFSKYLFAHDLKTNNRTVRVSVRMNTIF
jgi:hypothetical protein